MTLDSMQHPLDADSTATPRQFLAFNLDDDEYAIDIRQVQELRGVDQFTRIANAPPHIKGVLNLRGLIVPLIDLRLKLNMQDRDYDAFTVVIVLNSHGRTIGVVVDSVSDVATLETAQIKPPPSLGSSFSTDYLIGLGTVEERMLILVDLGRLINETDFADTATLH